MARRSERLFYRPRPFLLISRLVFKAQENYRVLSAVSLLVAVIVSAVGAVYSVYLVVGMNAVAVAPQPLQLAVNGGDPGREAAAGRSSSPAAALPASSVCASTR